MSTRSSSTRTAIRSTSFGSIWTDDGVGLGRGVGGGGALNTEPAVISDDRRGAVRRAAKSWTEQLIDVSGNNKLLFYRPLKVGTLDVTPGVEGLDLPELLRLRGGSSVRLSRLFPDDEARAGAAKRLRNIAAKAQENDEERGISTLFLAWGMATWTNPNPSRSTPMAPVFLVPIVARRRNASGDDFDLEVAGEASCNPTLVHYLFTQLSTSVNADAVLAAAEAVEQPLGNPEAGLDAIRLACSAVPGFAVNERVVIGNFSFAKMPMVRTSSRTRRPSRSTT
ncbi:MAG: DUF4011 domain-containing protein [Acidimicrobiales bacterium]|nr:DUF4011 domain-containing protein [Acidimicrobiales bacterium]